MKAPNESNKRARVIARMELDLEMSVTQERLWQLRAKAKRLRIAEQKRQIREVRQKR